MALSSGEAEWRAAVKCLANQLEIDTARPVPKGQAAWSKAYIAYLLALKKLDAALGRCVQPQKRTAAKDVLRCCLGRLLELHKYLVELNGGNDILSLDPSFPELRLTPGDLEVPIPACFLEEAEAVAARRQEYLKQLTSPEPGEDDADSSGSESDSDAESVTGQLTCRSIVSQPWSRPGTAQAPRKRQHPGPAGCGSRPSTPAAAATRIQAAMRGWTSRRHVTPLEQAELVFLGMQPGDASRGNNLRQQDAADAEQRRALTLQRMTEFTDSYATLKQEVRDAELGAKKVDFKHKIAAWCHENRNPITGELPEVPGEADGGSRVIFEAPRPMSLEPPLAGSKGGKAADGKGAAAGKAGAKGTAAPPAKAPAGKPGKKGAAPPVAPAPTEFLPDLTKSLETLEQLRAAIQPPDILSALATQPLPAPRSCGKEDWRVLRGEASFRRPTVRFADPFQAAVTDQAPAEEEEQDPLDALLDAIERRAAHAAHRPNADLVKAELRPLVTEAARLQADKDMRSLVQELKDEAKERQPKSKAGKKGKGKGSKKGKEGGKKAAKEGGGGKKAGGKKSKDPTGTVPLESILAELAEAGIAKPTPSTSLGHYLGEAHLVPPARPNNPVDPPPAPSPAEVRRAITASYILPLIATPEARARLQPKQSVLLYGCQGTGKTLISQAIAHHAGAMWFDISPRTTDGAYPGKAVVTMLHNVFKMAKALAPSVIYLDEVEKVFIMDKKKQKSYGGSQPFNRIKKDLLKQVKKLSPEDGVVVIGNSTQPQACSRKEEAALKKLFPVRINVPLPDHASRLAIWKGVIRQTIGVCPPKLELTTLTRMTAGYTPASIKQIASRVLTRERCARLQQQPLTTAELCRCLTDIMPKPVDEQPQLLAWHVRPPPEPKPSGKDGKGKGKK